MKSESGFVYFLQTDDKKYVKVGFTTSLEKRLPQLRVDARKRFQCAGSFIAWTSGTFELETQFHRHLAPWRHSDEWYCNTPEVQSITANLEQALIEVRDSPRNQIHGLCLEIDCDLVDKVDEFRWRNRIASRTAALEWLLRFALDQKPKVEK